MGAIVAAGVGARVVGAGVAGVGEGVGAPVGEAVGAVVVAAHVLSKLQTPLLQSVDSIHLRPSGHAGQSEPPQSTSVSVSSLYPLLQTKAVGAMVVGAEVGMLVGVAVGAAVASRWQLYT